MYLLTNLFINLFIYYQCTKVKIKPVNYFTWYQSSQVFLPSGCWVGPPFSSSKFLVLGECCRVSHRRSASGLCKVMGNPPLRRTLLSGVRLLVSVQQAHYSWLRYLHQSLGSAILSFHFVQVGHCSSVFVQVEHYRSPCSNLMGSIGGN